MLFLLIRKEIVNNVLSFRFITTYVLLFSLILVAIVLMTNEYHARVQTYNHEISEQKTTGLDEIEALTDPGEQFTRFQQWDFSGARPTQKLSLLARGLEADLPTSVSGSRWYRFYSSRERLSKNLLYDIFQTPDFVFVVMVITSLLTLLFVFDSVCGEKQVGTLKLLMSNSVPRDIVLLGKWIGSYVSVVLPFSVAAFGGFVYVYTSGAITIGSEDLTVLVLIYLVSLIYISAFFALGIMISVFTHQPSTSLLVCLLVWIGWILVIPNVAPVIARIAAPVPSLNRVKAEREAIERETHIAIQRQKETMWETGALAEAAEAKIKEQGEQAQHELDKYYQDEVNAQTSLAKNLARISPAASFLLAATRLASTGPVLAKSFQTAKKRFRDQVQEYQRNLYRVGVEHTPEGPKMKNPEWFDPDDVPRFQLITAPLADRLDDASSDVLLLLLYNVVFFYVVIRRLSPLRCDLDGMRSCYCI